MNKFFRIENQEFSVEIPEYIEKYNKKGWVNYGVDNLYPQYLISLVSKSSRHASILKKKAMLVGGRGFIKDSLSENALLFIKNSKNEDDLDTILAKISYDFEMSGGFFLNLIWSKDRKYITEINYIDFSKVRIKPENEDGPEGYFICDGWEDIRKYTPVLYPSFSTINRKEASQILYVKSHRPGTEYYSQPDYKPGVFWMEMEWKISEYHLSSIKNGFHPSYHINWPFGSSASDEEVEDLVSRLKMDFSNAVNAGEPFITINDDETKPQITPIEHNSSDERYISIDKIIESSILHAHRVNNPALFGVEVAAKLGDTSGDDRIQSIQEFEIDYVIPQQRIIEKVINRIAKINGIYEEFKINKYSDSYKKVGADSVKDVLAIIESESLQPEQKYHLLVSLNYSDDLSMKLSGYIKN